MNKTAVFVIVDQHDHEVKGVFSDLEWACSYVRTLTEPMRYYRIISFIVDANKDIKEAI